MTAVLDQVIRRQKIVNARHGRAFTPGFAHKGRGAAACHLAGPARQCGAFVIDFVPPAIVVARSGRQRARGPGHRFTFERTAACSDLTRTGDSAGIRPPARSFPRLPQPPHRPRGQPLSLPGQRRASPSWEAVRAPSGPAKRGHSLRRFFRTAALARQYAQFEPNTRSVRPLSRRTGSVKRRCSRSRRDAVV
jgi:hypothetical protein